MNEIKHTLLHPWHEQHGAQLAAFGGYHMPLWYKTGPIQEHRAVLRGAGLFDTSHMAELLIIGPGARTLLQRALTRNLDACIGKPLGPLPPGRAAYGFLLKENGHVLDDAIVLMESPERYLLVVNAGMGAPVATHLKTLAQDLEVTVEDLTDRLSKLDLQGPASAHILRRVLADASVLKPLPTFGFAGHYDEALQGMVSRNGAPFLLSRTGYTGEFGFELFVRPPHFVQLWEQLLEAGEREGLIACGLGARDSLRAGAGLPLSHQDIGEWPCVNHPWSFALSQDGQGGFTKTFHGDQALLHAHNAPHTYAFRGANGRKVEGGAEVLLGPKVIGTVLTCATDMAIDLVEGRVLSLASPDAPPGFAPRGLCCGFVRVDQALPMGTELLLRDKRRETPVLLVKDVRPDRSARKPLW